MPKSAIASTAEKAKNGVTRYAFSGSFRRYLDKEFNVGECDLRIYQQNIWLFKGDKLVTVWAVPQKYRKYKPSEKESPNER